MLDLFAGKLKGKKTYLAAVALVGLAAADYMGYPIPNAAWILLNGIGLGGLRQAVGK